MGLINIYDNRELVVLRLGTLPALGPMKGPTSELREDINDEITQVVDLKDEESESVILNGSTYTLGTYSSYPSKK